MVSVQSYNCLLILGVVYFGSTASTIEAYDHPYGCCNGSIAECDQQGEMLMESEISRRILAAKKYITPGALARDQPACKGSRGQAYSKSSDCVPQQSNPPERGCQTYYRCRS